MPLYGGRIDTATQNLYFADRATELLEWKQLYAVADTSNFNIKPWRTNCDSPGGSQLDSLVAPARAFILPWIKG